MKRIIFTAIIMLGVVSSQAQKVKQGSFHVLSNEKSVSVKIDYTESTIAKVPFDIFLEGEEDWDESYQEILLKFVKSANQKSKGLKYLTKPTSNYFLIFKPLKIDNDGETRGILLLVDRDDNVIGVAELFHARGGKFGSQINLMGDASIRLGKKVATFINTHSKD